MDLVFPEIKNDVTKCPTTHENEGANGFVPTETKPYSEWEFDAATAVLEKNQQKKEEREAKKAQKDKAYEAKQKRERQERYIMLKMGRLMQDSIIAAGRITETVLKAARDGRPPEEIALAAVKGLSLLVNDKMVYDVIERKYRQEYGIALEEKPPFNIVHLEPDKK